MYRKKEEKYMKILSVNAGSSSLKFTMFEMPEENVIINGTLNNNFVELDIAFTCANVPIPKNATPIPKNAKIFPNHFSPNPFSI